jgi:putative ABC transport system substrate-binding protein
VRRRQFITLLGGAAAAWPLAARAQQAARVQRLGVLSSADAGDPEGKAQLFAFYGGAAALGWADGPNLRMEISLGGGNVNRALHQRCFGTAIIYGASK